MFRATPKVNYGEPVRIKDLTLLTPQALRLYVLLHSKSAIWTRHPELCKLVNKTRQRTIVILKELEYAGLVYVDRKGPGYVNQIRLYRKILVKRSEDNFVVF